MGTAPTRWSPTKSSARRSGIRCSKEPRTAPAISRWASAEATAAKRSSWRGPPTTAGTYIFDTYGSDWDTILYARDPSCPGLEFGCNDDSEERGSLQSALTLDLAAGETVWLVVDGYEVITQGTGGPIQLNVTPLSLPSEEGFCLDDRDNDEDELFDCQDPDCYDAPHCQPLEGIVDICAGNQHTCAVQADGRVLCWGDGSNQQLGHGSNGRAMRPVYAEGLDDIEQIACGDWHTCARAGNGDAYCWGQGWSGQIGTGDYNGYNTPQLVQDLPPAIDIGVGSNHTCAGCRRR